MRWNWTIYVPASNVSRAADITAGSVRQSSRLTTPVTQDKMKVEHSVLYWLIVVREMNCTQGPKLAHQMRIKISCHRRVAETTSLHTHYYNTSCFCWERPAVEQSHNAKKTKGSAIVSSTSSIHLGLLSLRNKFVGRPLLLTILIDFSPTHSSSLAFLQFRPTLL